MNEGKVICCPEFNRALWDNKTQVWQDKLFLKGEVFQFLHMPLNMGSVVRKMFQKIGMAHACPKPKDFLMLGYDPSPWKSEVYMTVTKPVPEAKMEKISGTFVSKVFDGSYAEVPKWKHEMNAYLYSNHQKPLKYYFHFAYCPKCTERYGHNYCVAFAQVH